MDLIGTTDQRAKLGSSHFEPWHFHLKGEIYEVDTGEDGYPYKVVIVSGDDWNQGISPQCVEIVRAHNAQEIPPFMVLLDDQRDS